MSTAKGALGNVSIADYDAAWPEIFMRERARIEAAPGISFSAFEHVGSTAVPGLNAKPIIDMMASVESLSGAAALLPPLAALGYECIDVGFKTRLFLCKHPNRDACGFHLHIVEAATWPERHERLFRDYLLAHPGAARDYGDLKTRMAAQFPDDSPAYTRAKTGTIQRIVDAARAEKGLPQVTIWEE